MRKIDAVLLSALILYDYSAQSLVDSDSISLGHSFINNGFHDNKLTDPQFNFTPEFNNEEAAVVRGVKHLNVVPVSNTTQKNISYYELAKVNPATAPQVSNVAENAATENTEANIPVAVEAVESVSFDKEAVEVSDVAYSNTEALAASTIDEHVNNVADAATFDSDNDGVYDVEDKCAGVAGVARFEGCPVPDTDADGINDEEDRCPMEKGSADNFGCPVAVSEVPATSEAAPAVSTNDNTVEINFAGDNKALSNEDFNIVLHITDILLSNADAKVEVEGNTNNDGSTKSPVEKVSNYFKDLGVNNSQIVIKAVTEIKNIDSSSSKVLIRLLQ